MGDRRMFSKSVVDTDYFLDMPLSSQALYFHLGLRADDDGFVASPRTIMRACAASNDDLKLLTAKGYIIPFETGVVVIAHWRRHNSVHKDRYKETIYTSEKSMLLLGEQNVYTLVSDCIQDDTHPVTQDKLSQVKITKASAIEETSLSEHKQKKSIRHQYGLYNNVLLTDEEMEKLKAEFPNDYHKNIDRLSEYMKSTGKSYNDHLATIRSWARKDSEKQQAEKPKNELYNPEIKGVLE